MKYIITEEQSLKLRLLRRLYDIDDAIPFKLRHIFRLYKICEMSVDIFIDSVVGEITSDMYYAYFSDIDDDSKEWNEAYNIIRKYIETVHHTTISNFYSETCKQV